MVAAIDSAGVFIACAPNPTGPHLLGDLLPELLSRYGLMPPDAEGRHRAGDVASLKAEMARGAMPSAVDGGRGGPDRRTAA